MPGRGDLDGDGKISFEEMRKMGAGRSAAPSAGHKELNLGSSKPGGAVDTSKETPRPDGPSGSSGEDPYHQRSDGPPRHLLKGPTCPHTHTHTHTYTHLHTH